MGVFTAVVAGALIGGSDVAPAATAPGHIGNRAFVDSNRNGRQDAGEPGLAGVRITLSNLAGKALFTGLTDSGGWWGLNNLSTTTCYRLTYTLPGGYVAGPTATGGSTIGVDGKVPQQICPTAAPQDQWDAGFVVQSGGTTKNGYIGHRVYVDANGNGDYNTGETGPAGIPIQLRDLDGKILVAGTTSAGGWYGFRNLEVGRCYLVAITIPAGFRSSGSQLGANGVWASPICLSAANPTTEGVNPPITNRPANPTGGVPTTPTYLKARSAPDFFEISTGATITNDGGRQHLQVVMSPTFAHAADGTVTDVREDNCCFSPTAGFTPPSGVTTIVPGRYEATRSAATSSGFLDWNDNDGCSGDITFDVSRIVVTPSTDAVTSLVMTIDDRCNDRIARIEINPGPAQARPDRDGDGDSDSYDNCLTTANADQADGDGDGIGNVCDTTALRRSLTLTSPLGEEVFRNTSFTATSANSGFDLVTVPTTPGAPVVDAAGVSLQDFTVIVQVNTSRAGFNYRGARFELWFRKGQATSGTFTATGSGLRGLVFGSAGGIELSACAGSDPSPSDASVLGTAGAATSATVEITALTFDAGRTQPTRLASTIRQRCTPSSAQLTAALVYDQPA